MHRRDLTRNICSCLVAGLMLLTVAGCPFEAYIARQPVQSVAEQPVAPLPLFPPQRVLDSGDFTGFVTENEAALERCWEDDECAVALFNLGFVHGYSKSPYYNLGEAVQCFQELIRRYPESPWAYQAQAWMDLLKRNFTVENGWRRLRKEVKSMQGIINDLNTQVVKQSRQGLEGEERQCLEDEIRMKDELIGELSKRIERYREIDVEIEEREREILY